VVFSYRGETWPASFARIEAHPTVKIGITFTLPPTAQDWTDGWGAIALDTLAPPIAWPTTNLVLIDDAAGGQSVTLPMKPDRYTLPWDRPVPVGVFNGQKFNDREKFVRFLCQQYSQLASARPPAINACVIWCGSPAMSPPIEWIMIQFRCRLIGGHSQVKQTDKEAADRADQAPKQFYDELRKALRLPDAKDLHHGFLEALRRMVDVTQRDSVGELEQVNQALFRAVRVPPGGILVKSYEDFAGAAMAIFFAGLLAYDYRHGIVLSENDNPLYRVGASFQLH